MPKKYPNIITASTSVLVKEILGRLKLVVPEVVHFFRRFCYLLPYRYTYRLSVDGSMDQNSAYVIYAMDLPRSAQGK